MYLAIRNKILHVKKYNRQMPPLLQECSRVIQEVIALAKLSARDISKAAKLELCLDISRILIAGDA